VARPDLERLLHALVRQREAATVSEGLLAQAGLSGAADELRSLVGVSVSAAALAVRMALAERRHRPRPRIDLVWTGPEAVVSTSRDTAVVVRRLFREAKKSVLVAGYAFDHGADIFQPLHTAMQERGITATIYLDIAGQALTSDGAAAHATEKVELFLQKNWPFGDPRPTLYYDPRTATPAAWVSLHAKCVVVDGEKALVTSANFTDRGQTRNIEVGALIDDPGFARDLAAQWQGLVDSNLLQRYKG
jgi:phosphatidylserine/phosphatidylglycerophosphate/cardiolipin synthase-like enzyme